MKSQDVKKYLAGLCLATLLSGANLAAPGGAFGTSS
jgi:radical SAM modification target selenobiotic family peptide